MRAFTDSFHQFDIESEDHHHLSQTNNSFDGVFASLGALQQSENTKNTKKIQVKLSIIPIVADRHEEGCILTFIVV